MIQNNFKLVKQTRICFIATHQESFVSVYDVEEPAKKVHDDVEKRLDDDRPHLHEPGAVEAVLLHQHDVEVEEGEQGAKDCESCEHWSERDIEQVLEGWAREHLGRILWVGHLYIALWGRCKMGSKVANFDKLFLHGS